MSDTEFFKKMVAAGEEGEEVIMRQLPFVCKCWRGVGVNVEGHNRCYRPPQLIDKRKDRAFQEALDIDAQLHFDCSGCPVFERLGVNGDTVKDEWHEIKTNYETHGQSASGSGKEYTQNIAIETEEDRYWTKNHMGKKYQMPLRALEDPRDGKGLCVRNGAGWFNKTTALNSDGQWGRVLADWFHFYQPIDAEDFANWNVERATQEEIEAWLNDDTVPAGSTLITQYPFSYCISIRGSYLEQMAETQDIIGYDEILEEDETRARYPEVSIGKKQKAILIPIADILPCLVYRGGADPEAAEGTGSLYSAKDIITFIAGDSIIQKPLSANGTQWEAPRRYIIRRIYEFTNPVYNPQRVSKKVNGKEITIAEGAGIEVIAVKPQQEKHRAKQVVTENTRWRDKYSDMYLMPKVLELMAAVAEKY